MRRTQPNERGDPSRHGQRIDHDVVNEPTMIKASFLGFGQHRPDLSLVVEDIEDAADEIGDDGRNADQAADRAAR